MSSQEEFKVKTSDDVEHIITRETIDKCQTLKTLLEDGCFEDVNESLPIPSVSSETFAWIQSYCAEHKDEENPTEEQIEQTKTNEIEGWDKTFINGFLKHQLFDLIMAANYLDCPGLLNLGCKKIAFMIRGKTPQEIRDEFGIENDFTPEEEEQIKKENEWCEEKP